MIPDLIDVKEQLITQNEKSGKRGKNRTVKDKTRGRKKDTSRGLNRLVSNRCRRGGRGRGWGGGSHGRGRSARVGLLAGWILILACSPFDGLSPLNLLQQFPPSRDEVGVLELKVLGVCASGIVHFVKSIHVQLPGRKR